jgi:superfamily I DNA/RNA helicase
MAWDSDLDPQSPAFNIAADNSRYVRVLAGPGTGKSFALKRRVARLLENGVAPARILAVTFTKVAAEDLQRELFNMGLPGCEQITRLDSSFTWYAGAEPAERPCCHRARGTAVESIRDGTAPL